MILASMVGKLDAIKNTVRAGPYITRVFAPSQYLQPNLIIFVRKSLKLLKIVILWSKFPYSLK
jgi:hypothetical protein